MPSVETATPATSPAPPAIQPTRCAEGYVYTRYVLHSRVAEFEAMGWRRDPSVPHRPSHHDHYSVIMVWCGEGTPE